MTAQQTHTLAWIGGIIAVFLLFFWINSTIDNVRGEAESWRQEAFRSYEREQLQEKLYRDSLDGIIKGFNTLLEQSDLRLDSIETLKDNAGNTYDSTLRAIQSYTNLDQRIRALSRAIARQDTIRERYLDRDNRRDHR